MNQTTTKKPIINCHAHIFTGDYVPPLLGKGILPSFISWIAHLRVFIWVMRYIVMPVRRPDPEDGTVVDKLTFFIKRIRLWLYDRYTDFPIVPRITEALQYVLGLIALWIIGQWMEISIVLGEGKIGSLLTDTGQWINEFVSSTFPKQWQKILYVMIIVLFVKSARNLVLFVLRTMKKIPGKFSTALIKRYLQMAEYAKYRQQFRIFDRLKRQYPNGSRFVILPMDMKYMKAGTLKRCPEEYKLEKNVEVPKETIAWDDPQLLIRHRESYYLQLEKLRDLKKNRGDIVYPFIFLHPDRLKSTPITADQKPFFDYSVSDAGTVTLKDCWLKRYLEPNDDSTRFSGFKIYPALGYYPFDIELLPMWKYAVDHQIPIMTHCTIGTIFYRGWKKRNWNRHMVFHQSNDSSRKLRLSDTRAKHYQRDFTNPLNYLCLLNPELLVQVLNYYFNSKETSDVQQSNLIKIFGKAETPAQLKCNLSTLKICFGHYGGIDEWQKHINQDRDNEASQIMAYPHMGSRLVHRVDGGISWYKAREAWHDMDWYTMISSLMLQYPNVYSDISYMLHNESIFPLLRKTIDHLRGPDPETPNYLKNVGLRLPEHEIGERILFGTDFYMIRSHKTERDLLNQTQALLSVDQFDQIARDNPLFFLKTKQ